MADYRNRVNELDPYAAFAKDSLFHTESIADNMVSLDRLEYTGQAVDDKEIMGIGLESDFDGDRPQFRSTQMVEGRFNARYR